MVDEDHSSIRPAPSSGYEEREGGVGANVHFRARRYPAKELLERVPAILIVAGEQRELRDVSMNGLSFFAPETSSPSVGTRWSLDLTIGDATVYSGFGEVVRTEEHRLGKLVALQLTEGFLDIPGMVRTHDEVVLQRDLASGFPHAVEGVSGDYRRLCADMVACLRHYRSVAERYEQSIRAIGGDRRGTYSVMLDQCFARLCTDWDLLRTQANELIQDVWSDPGAIKAVKWLTETLVTPDLSAGPAWARSYKKPLGYPGDYVIMNYFYDQAWEGDTLFAKLVHRLLTTDPLPACVIPRMEMLRDAIATTLEERKTRGQPVRIASLGSGPAREVEEYLKRWQTPQPLHVILIDQDERALSYAYNRLYPLAARSTAPVKVQCLYVSFSQLVRQADVLGSLPQLDLVYAAGLVDYLRPITAKTIIRTLYAQLGPGGRLVAGNMKARPDVGWTNECALDWPLIFRTEDEMTDLAHGLEAAEVDVRLERSGYTYLLFVTKT